MNPAGLAIIALGSNLGDSRSVIQAAFQKLEALSVQPILRSSLWASAPIDCPPGSPTFVNAAAAILPRPQETPASLLSKLQGLEAEFGRRPKVVLNEARPLDLDIILWGDLIINTPALSVPHLRALERRFVLEPLNEIVPDMTWPGSGRKISELCASLRSSGQKISRLAS